MNFFYLTAAMILFKSIKMSNVKLDKLEVYDINESRDGSNGMPLIFKLHIKFENLSYNILFQNSYELNVENYDLQNDIRAYKSIKFNNVNSKLNYEANCILKKNKSYLSLNRSSLFNLIHFYELNLNIFMKDEIEIANKSYFAYEMLSVNKLDDSFMYYAYKTRYKIEEKVSVNNKKKRSVKKKFHLNVQTCIHIDQTVYILMQKFLNTSNDDYISMYLKLQFRQTNLGINKIYESFDDPLFKVNTEITEFVIHKSRIETIDFSDSGKLFFSVNKFIDSYYSGVARCGHVFFVYKYTWDKDYVLGRAFIGHVCDVNYHASVIRYTNQNDLIMAHELGHNLGAYHDDHEIEAKFNCNHQNANLMWFSTTYSSLGYLVSNCTILQIKQLLFQNNEETISKRFECLLNKSKNETNIYERLSIRKLPGYYLSLSDQCRLVTNDSDSFSCGIDYEGCRLKCSVLNRTSNLYICDEIAGLLDGSYCGENKYCYRSECLDFNLTFGHRNKLIKKIEIKNLNDIYSDQSRKKCPTGVSQERRFFKNIYRFDNIVNHWVFVIL
jgi:hypothetical protein